MIAKTVQHFKESSFSEKLIYFYVLMLPAPYWYISFLNKMIQPSDLVFFILFPVWCLHKFGQKCTLSFNSENRIYLFAIALLVVTLCSFINSINRFHSMVDWLGLLYLAVLFIIITDIINTNEKLKKLLIAYSLAAVIAALVGLGAFIHYLFTHNPQTNPFLYFYSDEASVLFFPRIKSSFYTPNMFTVFEHIGLTVLSGLIFLIKKEKTTSIFDFLLFVAIACVIVSIALTGSQTLAGVSLTIFMITWLFRGKIMTTIRYVAFLFTLIVIIFGVCATIWTIYPLEIKNDFQQGWLNIQINTAYSPHIIPSIYAISMFKKHPILGVGIGTFREQYPKYIDMGINKFSSVNMEVPVDRISDPHNTYTGALAEWGSLGFLAMIIFFIQFIRMLIWRNNFGDSVLSDGLRFSLLAGFVGFLFNGLFIDIIMMRHLWIFLAIICACSNIKMNNILHENINFKSSC